MHGFSLKERKNTHKSGFTSRVSEEDEYVKMKDLEEKTKEEKRNASCINELLARSRCTFWTSN
jgi:hypothetical protein